MALVMAFASVGLGMADTYDPRNYPPKVDTLSIGQTNLPIVFVDTRCGDTATHAIHRYDRIAVRMKIIDNGDGVNYGDTLSHPLQTVDFDGWVAIRYRGNTSFNWSDKKPYNFKTMKTADPEGTKLKAGLLGMPKDHTWVLLAPHEDHTLLRDVLVFQLARPWFEYTPRCRYCELVLDGVYYGIYILSENIRKGENRLDLDDPGLSGDALTGGYQLQIDRNDEPHYYTLKHPAVDNLGQPFKVYNRIYLQYKHPDYADMLPEQLDYIHQRIDLMEDVLASDYFTDPETGYRQYLDPMSFIDQQLSQEFSGNVDGYRLSTNIYKRRDSQDARFKTALWDFNMAFGNSGIANSKSTDFWRYQNLYLANYAGSNKVPFWWMRLMEDPTYVVQLKGRWAAYRQTNYSDSHIECTIDSITTLLRQGGALERNNAAWQLMSSSSYDSEIDNLKQWIRARVAWMDSQLDYAASNSGIQDAPLTSNALRRKAVVGYYSLSGTRLSRPQVGRMTIVRLADGTTKKAVWLDMKSSQTDY